MHTTRREFLGTAASLAACALVGARSAQTIAQIAITLDLEMSRNFPDWETTHWDYEKGNLNEDTKRYTTKACGLVRKRGGTIHCFAVGQVFEQADLSWLQAIRDAGHPVGNHTYDHVNVKATALEQIQFRFQRAPWLIAGKQPADVIRENIRLCSLAMEARTGAPPAGFRTPGGFPDGLADRPDVQDMLVDLGFTWVSSKYPPHPIGEPGQPPDEKTYAGIVAAQADAQPFRYPGGLVEVPMSPISDISAFRGGRWKLEWFLEAIRQALEWTIAEGGVFDFLGHPSCLGVVDPELRTIGLICDMVAEAGKKAALVDLGAIAARVT